jgi:hypothetical protein
MSKKKSKSLKTKKASIIKKNYWAEKKTIEKESSKKERC